MKVWARHLTGSLFRQKQKADPDSPDRRVRCVKLIPFASTLPNPVDTIRVWIGHMRKGAAGSPEDPKFRKTCW